MNDRAPNAAAAGMFPAAARANRSIFYDRQGNARSLAEIRERFAAKLQRGFDSVGGAIQYAEDSLPAGAKAVRMEENTTELQSLMRQPYTHYRMKKKTTQKNSNKN